jgi:hypothetical protein
MAFDNTGITQAYEDWSEAQTRCHELHQEIKQQVIGPDGVYNSWRVSGWSMDALERAKEDAIKKFVELVKLTKTLV